MHRKYACIWTLALILLIPQLGHSSQTIYTDESSFSSAAGSVTVEDFNDTVFNPGLGVTLSADGYIDTANGLLYDDLLRGFRETRFTFDSAITAFAGDIFDLSPGGVGYGIELTVFFSGGGSQVLSTIITDSGFFGFVSDQAIDSVLLQDYTGGRERYNLYSLVYTSQVPEPATILLLSLSLLGLAGMRRK
jgi:hypothetical protein